jgi:hypothetical protein
MEPMMSRVDGEGATSVLGSAGRERDVVESMSGTEGIPRAVLRFFLFGALSSSEQVSFLALIAEEPRFILALPQDVLSCTAPEL